MRLLKEAKRIKTRHGAGMVGALIAVAAVGLLVVPISHWYLSLSDGVHHVAEQKEVQALLQDYWSKLTILTHDEIQEAIVVRGLSWLEDTSDKYDLKVEFSADGKYIDGSCSVGTSVGAGESHCRNVVLSLVEKGGVLTKAKAETVIVTTQTSSPRLAAMENGIAANNNRFSQYYKKDEEDVRYVKKNEKP
ncbi:MAG: hypothetical protein E7199_03610 [Schwartzia succinivorans]|nr:hypothetical protein [Schwartzia succinivorans]